MSLSTLKELAKLREKSAGLMQQRHQRSEETLEQGLRHLASALADPAGQKQALVLASEAFLETIKGNRRDPAGYLAMAHVFLLLDQPRKAMPYLHEARRVAPEHADVQLMLTHIQELGKQPSASPHLDFDATYDSLEQKLQDFLRRQMGHPAILWKPDIAEERLVQLRALLVQIENMLAEARPAMEQLHKELETSGLDRQLQQLEKLQKRHQLLHRQSLDFQAKIRDLKQDAQRAERIARALYALELGAGDLKEQERLLEILLDRCDKHADDLDAWDQQKLDISPVRPAYKHLLAQVSALQSLLDDLQTSEIER